MVKKKTGKKSEGKTSRVKVETIKNMTLKAEGKSGVNDNAQFAWIVFGIIIVLAAVLIPYFWIEGSKSYEYAGIDWTEESYEHFDIYHGRFVSPSNADLMYNIFLREDPRDNAVETVGVFDQFKNGAVVSLTPEIDRCRGEVSRIMIDLGSFLAQGVGVGSIHPGSTDQFVAVETDRLYGLCNTVSDKTVVIIELGESKVVRNDDNPYCYRIYVEDCDDISPIERFMVKSVEDFSGVR